MIGGYLYHGRLLHTTAEINLLLINKSNKMNEISKIQLNNFNRLLMEKGLTKRQLAAHLGVHENGMNRILSCPDMKLKRLVSIATFLDIGESVLRQMIYESKVQEHALRQGSEKSDVDSCIL
ncbi:hypothetical protein AGMMS49525_03590 [Bacteroidia bacterium]|nr:hypothetical protein AGMMS49525_03590 [Bacteroidia bacterium]